MAEKPKDEGQSKKGEPISDIEINSEAFSKLTDSELRDVAGGMLPRGERGTTLNPTSTDGCCGA